MAQIKLLDCTLRDGGYINDWKFGKTAISDMTRKLESSGVEILELGFMKNEPYDEARTVFNDMAQVKKVIGHKKAGVQYAVMAEVVNPLPLDMLTPADAQGPEIIRVIVWKRMLKEGFEYCKGIVEKGYKLCVQPARVSQYSDEEFIDMVKMFNQLDPLAIYVVDSWGTMYQDELLHYLHLADKYMKPNISVGYHGHNNMMQAFDVACAFAREKLDRDLIIDASVYGIGRGAGNLNTEIFAKFMNEKYGRTYDLQPLLAVYNTYISKIYDKCKWGYSIPYFISAKYNCNPNYASYYAAENISPVMIENIISTMKPEERIMFKEENACKALSAQWKNKLGIIVPTANRPQILSELIKSMSAAIMKYNVDLIIVDSSKNQETKKVVQSFQQEGVTNLIYDFYDAPTDRLSIDNKVIYAYKKYAAKYEYVMGSRDGLSLNLKSFLPILESSVYDLLVLNLPKRDYYGKDKDYTDCGQLFSDLVQHMSILGTMIFKSELVLSVLKECPLNKETNYSLWQPIAFFEYFASHRFRAAYRLTNAWTHIIPAKKNHYSFWHKLTLWQWGERWYKCISSLPSVYDKYKPAVLKFSLYDCKPFSLPFVLHVQKLGGWTPLKVYKNRKYLSYVCKTPLWKLYAVSLLPRAFSRQLFKKNWEDGSLLVTKRETQD
ncbi:MAG: hypothetical protein SPI69_04130 [Elusimicrobiaceae bacterium]|nr:hypothetical protein [Elusimicrobiaceae bacterium]